MLLRLLPAPSASQPAPPTILFTLPLPVNAYTSKSLPLPPLLQQHRTACQQEGLECNNALLGEKSSWISGIVDEVTFCVAAGRITMHLIDGSTRSIPITSECMSMLAEVVIQVQLSFAATTTPPASPVAATSSRGASVSQKRTPSTLLCSLLSPLLIPNASRTAFPKPTQNTARAYRRQARSLLVDAYRRHVQTILKDSMPSNYLSWVVQSELELHQADWNNLRTEVDSVLGLAGVPLAVKSFRASLIAARLARASSPTASDAETSSLSSDSSSDDDESGPSTPATSDFSHDYQSMINPLSQLTSLPAASSIPLAYRERYTSLVSELSSIASRMASLRKRRVALEREAGRLAWLESMEASRMQDRAQRRAWSNMASVHTDNYTFSRPNKSTSLWQVEGTEVPEAPCHPAMAEEMERVASLTAESEDEDVFAADIEVRPLSLTAYDVVPFRPRLLSSASIRSYGSSSSEESDEMDFEPEAEPVVCNSPRLWTREIMDNALDSEASGPGVVGKESWTRLVPGEVIVVQA